MITRAMLLAAGGGTRLKPLTDNRPKPMLPLGGRPLIEHTIRQLVKVGVRDAVINLCHCPEAVIDYFGDGSNFGLNLTYSVETELLGTAGGLKKVEDFFRGEPFYLMYGDNLSTCNLSKLAQAHEKHAGIATTALFWKEDVSPHSAVEILGDDRIVKFVEKPKRGEEPSHWFSAGVNVMESRITDYIPTEQYCDIGYYLFPKIIEAGQNLYGYYMTEDEGLWWIDTPEHYARMSELWKDGFPV
ncbi:MAG TPA: NDP-sugar synthase [Pyrinomonadaceae bacterium]|nr:NDP-sugar synthase [Pyrinomonadaceae bacterium]